MSVERAFRSLERRLPEPEPVLLGRILQSERLEPVVVPARRWSRPIVFAAPGVLVAAVAVAVVAVVSRAPGRVSSEPVRPSGSVIAAVRVTGAPTTLPPGAFGDVDGAREIVASSVRSIGPAVTFTLTNGDVCIGADHGVAGAPRVWISCYPATYAGVLLAGWIGPHTVIGVTRGDIRSVRLLARGGARALPLRNGVFTATVRDDDYFEARDRSGTRATLPIPPRANVEAHPSVDDQTSLLARAGTASGRGRLLAQVGATTYRASASTANGQPVVCLEIGGGRYGGSACVAVQASAAGFALTCGRTAIVVTATGVPSAFVDDMMPPGETDGATVNRVAVIRVPLTELGHRWFAGTWGARTADGGSPQNLVPVYAVPVAC